MGNQGHRGGGIKTVFVFDHQCFHTVTVFSRDQLLTVYVKNESILSLWFMLHPPPPNSIPPTPTPVASVARHSCLIGLLNEEWVIFGGF